MTREEAKQEAIRKAYGKHWDRLREYITPNGWLNKKVFNDYDSLKYEDLDIHFEHMIECEFCRPYSLSGFDSNNGWTRIESEEDLPKEDDTEYFIIDEDETEYTGVYYFGSNLWIKGNHSFNPTHYQPIVKPQSPIY